MYDIQLHPYVYVYVVFEFVFYNRTPTKHLDWSICSSWEGREQYSKRPRWPNRLSLRSIPTHSWSLDQPQPRPRPETSLVSPTLRPNDLSAGFNIPQVAELRSPLQQHLDQCSHYPRSRALERGHGSPRREGWQGYIVPSEVSLHGALVSTTFRLAWLFDESGESGGGSNECKVFWINDRKMRIINLKVICGYIDFWRFGKVSIMLEVFYVSLLYV